MKLDPRERALLFQLTTLSSPKREKQLTPEHSDIVADLIYLTLLNLTETENFQGNNLEWLALRTGRNPNEIKRSIERLKETGLIERCLGDRGFKRTFLRLLVSDDKRSEAIQSVHRQSLDQARWSLLRDPVENRDFTAVTMPANPDFLITLKEKSELLKKRF